VAGVLIVWAITDEAATARATKYLANIAMDKRSFKRVWMWWWW